MAVDPRYEILFEPVRIGPVTAPNRFYQVPHCTGMGYNRPNSVAAMRETKAEGGWGVVCTEYCSIHPSSDDSPLPSHSLWDEKDVLSHAKIVESSRFVGVHVQTTATSANNVPGNAPSPIVSRNGCAGTQYPSSIRTANPPITPMLFA